MKNRFVRTIYEPANPVPKVIRAMAVLALLFLGVVASLSGCSGNAVATAPVCVFRCDINSSAVKGL